MSENGHRSATAFRPQVQTLVLSNGVEVEVRKPDVAALIMRNADSEDIPAPLVNQVVDSLKTGQAKAVPYDWGAKDLAQLYAFMRLIVSATLVWPVVVPDDVIPNYELGQIHVSDLPIDDLKLIFGWATGGAAAAASAFPQTPGAGVAAASPGGDVPSTTKRAARNRK